MDVLHKAMAGVGCFLMLLLALTAWSGSQSAGEESPYRFGVVLVIAVLLIVYGFGAPR